MIFVDVRGNVGNQLFQYAFAQNIQELNNQKIVFSTYYIEKYSADYGIKFSLNQFITEKDNVVITNEKPIIRYRFFMQLSRIMEKISSITNNRFSLIDKIVFKLLSFFGIYIWMKESFIKFSIRKCDNYYICGYWQSEKFFSNISEKFRNKIKSSFVVEEKNKEFLTTIKSLNSVCVTIRRGDFISNSKFKKIYYICDQNYFYRGIIKIQEEIPDISLVVFSDDIEWAKRNLNVDIPIYFESGEDTLSQKLLLMSSCKHFILSNSSFSWWAEFLSSSSEKKVIAPSKWYTDNRKVDIWRKHWYLLKSDKEEKINE